MKARVTIRINSILMGRLNKSGKKEVMFLLEKQLIRAAKEYKK